MLCKNFHKTQYTGNSLDDFLAAMYVCPSKKVSVVFHKFYTNNICTLAKNDFCHTFHNHPDKRGEVRVWGGGIVSASVREDIKWYCISVEHVIFFFIINITISLLLLSQLS
jgi:hypothetical protein